MTRHVSGWLFILGLGLAVSLGSPVDAQESRTWTDSTGAFKIEAKFVAINGAKVRLMRGDGRTFEIELEKLSQSDREYVKSLEDNPFKETPANPFVEAGGMKEVTGDVTVDWSGVETLLLQADRDEWSHEPAASEIQLRPRSIPLPKKADFFEGLKGLAVNPRAQLAVVGYVMGGPRKDGGSRLVLCNLQTGRASGSIAIPGQMIPLAIHDDGRQILLRRSEFGFGNSDRLEIWTVQGNKAERQVAWVPYHDERAGNRDVIWATFLPEGRMATCNAGGRLTIWNQAQMQPLVTLPVGNGAVPALSADGRTIAACSGDRIGLLDIESLQVTAATSTPRKLTNPKLAFSPSGERLACIAQDQVLVWDTRTGEVQRDFATPGLPIFQGIAFPHDDFLLAGDKFLIGLQDQLRLWQYDGMEQVQSVNGHTFMALGDHNNPGALIVAKLPHKAAQDLLKKALTQPDLFVFKEGTTVQLDVSQIPPSEQNKVREHVVRRLEEMNCKVASQAEVSVVASVEGPKQRKIAYINSGEYDVQEFVSKLQFTYQGTTIWQSQGTNVPFFVQLKEGETIATVLQRAGESPNYHFFEKLVLPKLLQKPGEGSGPQARLTLGQSRVTTAGLP